MSEAGVRGARTGAAGSAMPAEGPAPSEKILLRMI